jgi:hypothetical protein
VKRKRKEEEERSEITIVHTSRSGKRKEDERGDKKGEE